MKLKMVQVTDPLEVARIVKAGKYRENLPFFVRNADGSLWVERKPTPCTKSAQ